MLGLAQAGCVRVALPLVIDDNGRASVQPGPAVILRAGERMSPEWDSARNRRYSYWCVYTYTRSGPLVTLEDVVDETGQSALLSWALVWPAVCVVPVVRVAEALYTYLAGAGAIPESAPRQEGGEHEDN